MAKMAKNHFLFLGFTVIIYFVIIYYDHIIMTQPERWQENELQKEITLWGRAVNVV